MYRPRSAIVGVAPSDVGVLGPDRTALELQAESALAALEDAGLDLGDVDALFTTSREGDMPCLQVADYLRITPRHFDSTDVGGSSFLSHVGHATMAIDAGVCDVALITYGSMQRSRPRKTSDPPNYADEFDSPWGLPRTVGSYALAAARHMAVYGSTPEQLASVAVTTRQWATMNPDALLRDPITVDDVLHSRPIAGPLHKLDCCLVTDGGGAVVMTSAERAARLRQPPVHVRGFGESLSHFRISNMRDVLAQDAAAASGAAAFAMAGLRPDQIDVAQIYDSFTITPILSLEALGFCAPGRGGDFVTDGRTAPGGDLPMNTQGGGLAYTHPGMFGIFTLIEATRQLRGEAGERQVPDCSVALAHGTGGVLSSAGTVILGREPR